MTFWRDSSTVEDLCKRIEATSEAAMLPRLLSALSLELEGQGDRMAREAAPFGETSRLERHRQLCAVVTALCDAADQALSGNELRRACVLLVRRVRAHLRSGGL